MMPEADTVADREWAALTMGSARESCGGRPDDAGRDHGPAQAAERLQDGNGQEPFVGRFGSYRPTVALVGPWR